jgi:hypothetical protein
MVDRHPVEGGPEILFDLGHEATDDRAEIVVLSAIISGSDHPKLVPVAVRAREERLAVGIVLDRRIKAPSFPAPTDPVALEIAKVGLGS